MRIRCCSASPTVPCNRSSICSAKTAATRKPSVARSSYRVDPACKRIEDFAHGLAVVASRARQHMERMIGAVHQMQGRRWKTTDRRLDQADLRKAVARSLQEQHRDIDFRK